MLKCEDCGKEINDGLFCSNCAWKEGKCWMCGKKPLYKVSDGVDADMCEKCWK